MINEVLGPAFNYYDCTAAAAATSAAAEASAMLAICTHLPAVFWRNKLRLILQNSSPKMERRRPVRSRVGGGQGGGGVVVGGDKAWSCPPFW